MIASCGFLENELRDGRQRGNVGRRQENKNREVESERKSEEEKVQAEILDRQEEQGSSKELKVVGVKKLLRAGMMPARTWEFMRWE